MLIDPLKNNTQMLIDLLKKMQTEKSIKMDKLEAIGLLV